MRAERNRLVLCVQVLVLAVLCWSDAAPILPPTPVFADTDSYEFRPGPRVGQRIRPGPGVDLSGMDLSDSLFVGMDLSNASFKGCNLQGARFCQIRFSSGGASFRGTDLRDAAFVESPAEPFKGRFGNCDFTDALINGLSFSRQQDHLTFEQIRSTRSYRRKDLSGCQIVVGVYEPGVWAYNTDRLSIRSVALDLRGFDLRRTIFVAGDLTRCDFRDAIITGATFFRSTVTPAQIKATKRFVLDPQGDVTTGSAYSNRVWRLVTCEGYADIGFSSVDLSAWDFTNADLRGTRFHGVNLDGVSFNGADISGAEFWRSISRQQILSTKSYQEGNLSEAVFIWLDLSKTDFSRQDLTGARFVYCDISAAVFTDAIVTNADFRYLDRSPTVEQIMSTWNYKHRRMVGIRLPADVANVLKQEQEKTN